MKKSVNYSAFERISSNMAREFGTIRKGEEEAYNQLLLPMESNLLKKNRNSQINNGRRAIEAIHICLFTVHGYLTETEYDLSDYITNENIAYTEGLLMSFDPFTNEELRHVLETERDLNSITYLQKYFAIPIMCLLRIEKSIELWTKEYGISGYFDFIEEHIGRKLVHDDKMDFTIVLQEQQM